MPLVSKVYEFRSLGQGTIPQIIKALEALITSLKGMNGDEVEQVFEDETLCTELQ